MSRYRKLAPQLWTGDLGIALREAVVAREPLALECAAIVPWLIGNHHGNAIGLYHLSPLFIEEGIGIASETSLECIRKLSRTGFLGYDERRRVVWIKELARHEWGESPNIAANAVKALVSMLPALVTPTCKSHLFQEFIDRYRDGWKAVFEAAGEPFTTHPERIQNACRTHPERMPHQDQDQDQDQEPEQEQDQEQEQECTRTAKRKPPDAEREHEILVLLGRIETRVPGWQKAWTDWFSALTKEKQRGWTPGSRCAKLKKFLALCDDYSPAEILDMATMATEHCWQGFELKWWLKERGNNGNGNGSSKPTARGGHSLALPAEPLSDRFANQRGEL